MWQHRIKFNNGLFVQINDMTEKWLLRYYTKKQILQSRRGCVYFSILLN